jgi:threonine dehydrogenase-like Zn-dependent dehydrogenase
MAGEVVEVAFDVVGTRVGDRVAIDPVLRCGECAACAAGHTEFCNSLLGVGAAAGDPVACARLREEEGIGGGFAERLIVPAANCIPLPDDLDFEAAALVEPLADVMHSIEAARLAPGDMTAVMGLGPMGLLHVEALLHAGHRVIGVDLREDRREIVTSLGATAVHPDDLTMVDAVFVTAGGGGYAPATTTALDHLAPGGRVVLFSSAPTGTLLPVDTNRIHYKRQSMLGVVGFDRRHADDAIRVLRGGGITVDVIRQPRVALADIGSAFQHVLDPGVLKTAIDISAPA